MTYSIPRMLAFFKIPNFLDSVNVCINGVQVQPENGI